MSSYRLLCAGGVSPSAVGATSAVIPTGPDWRGGEAAGPRRALPPEAARSGDALASGTAAVLDRLRSGLLAGRGGASIRVDGVDVLRVDFSTQRCMPGDAPASLGHASIPWREAARISMARAAEEILRSGPGVQPLCRLIWDAAMQVDAAQVDRPSSEHAIVHLRRWPSFQLLAHHHDYFRLSSLLIRRPSSILECARLLEVGVPEAMAFARAVYYIGCADLEAAAAPADDMVPESGRATSRLVGWWRQMRQGPRHGAAL